MKIYLGSDHRGYINKEGIEKYLKEKGYDVIDKGNPIHDPEDDYPDYAFAVAEEVANNPGSLGIVLCGSSNGVSVAANKVKGIFCSQVRNVDEAREDRKHHQTNVIALSADNLTLDQMRDILDVWLVTEFEGGRHERRMAKIWSYENRVFK